MTEPNELELGGMSPDVQAMLHAARPRSNDHADSEQARRIRAGLEKKLARTAAIATALIAQKAAAEVIVAAATGAATKSIAAKTGHAATSDAAHNAAHNAAQTAAQRAADAATATGTTAAGTTAAGTTAAGTTAAGTTAAGTTAAAGTSVIATALKAKLAGKIGVAAVGIAFAGGAGLGAGVHKAMTAPIEHTPDVTAIVPTANRPPLAHAPAPNLVANPETSPLAPTAEVDSASALEHVPGRVANPPTPQAEPSRSDLVLEQALLDRAQSAMAQGDYASALATLRSHATRFPHGELAEERAGFEVVALLRQAGGPTSPDWPTAQQKAQAFLRRHPSHGLAPMVRRLLDTVP